MSNAVTVNDLLDWIDHLTDKEKELPIIFSEKVFPELDEMYFPKHVGHYLTSSFDGFVVVCRKDYQAIIRKELEE